MSPSVIQPVARYGPEPSARASQLFQTSDPDLAAYLCARAHHLVGVATVCPRPIFSFSADAALSAEAFHQGASICAKTLLNAFHRLNSVVRNQNHSYACA